MKSYFIELGYANVLTYLNSGNIVFSVNESKEIDLADKIKKMIKVKFNLDNPVFVISQEGLNDTLRFAPNWWGTDDNEIYDNLIFLLPPISAEIIADKIGKPTIELEQICIYKNVIFWSFDRSKYAKANWWKKTASKGIGEMLTIRTSKTLKKIVKM